MSVTRVMYPYQIEWYARLADQCESTHDDWTPVCADCTDHCDMSPAYRMNGKPINPRAGRSVLLEEKLTSADIDC